ncbi:MAG: 3-isopropylmalate dehydratase large subunit [Pseudomonadota bacterium]
MASTLFDKLWASHRVTASDDGDDLLYIDRIALHERTGTIALNALAARDLPIRHPQHVFCVMDHIVDTLPGRGDDTQMPGGRDFIVSTRKAARHFGLRTFDVNDPDQGISHLVSAEQGFALPGLTLVCPDSHTCTLGALGTLAFGIGTSQAEHALATSTLRLRKPENLRVRFEGALAPGVFAKDLILKYMAEYGADAARGAAVEYAGSTVAALGIEDRMTLCNLAVEFSAFSATVAPDQTTFDYVHGKPLAPTGAAWETAVAQWRALRSDDDAAFSAEHLIDASRVTPMVTWGISPAQAAPLGGRVPDAQALDTPLGRKALAYMDLKPRQPLAGLPIDAAFIGSCTNARLSDLRVAAQLLKGRKVAPGVAAVCVPGSSRIKREAEVEGLDQVFREAGFAWREAGCSMCFYAGGETFGPGKRVVTSTNRNFEGRQGPGVRSHLASPAVVAASAVRGALTAPTELS